MSDSEFLVYLCKDTVHSLPIKPFTCGTFSYRKDEDHTLAYVPANMVLFLLNKLGTEINLHCEMPVQSATELFDEQPQYIPILKQLLKE